jgi:transposase
MPSRKRRRIRKLTVAQVRSIFKSKEPAADVAKRFDVSANLIYLIWSRRVHKAATEAIRKPIRRRARSLRKDIGGGPIRIDIDKLADALMKRFVSRLRRT